MRYSLYPTDAARTRDDVIDAVTRSGGDDRLVFTSLHLPEHAELAAFGAELARRHREQGVTFCADVSPLTLDRLGAGDESALALLREWGVTVLRIDFGFDAEAIRSIAQTSECRIAINASTGDRATLDDLAGVPLIGWHNFYPRPETGLTEEFYLSQNALLESRDIPVVAFLPGEVTRRAPLFEGLPTLEVSRHRNAWRNFLHLRRLSPGAQIVCAEGTLLPQHAEWIEHLERTGEITVPLSWIDPAAEGLLEGSQRLRVEDAAASFRLEGTRGMPRPREVVNGDVRDAGSLQMDLDLLGRYAGEIHLLRTDRPLVAGQARVGEIAGAYRGIVDDLRPGDALRFVPVA